MKKPLNIKKFLLPNIPYVSAAQFNAPFMLLLSPPSLSSSPTERRE